MAGSSQISNERRALSAASYSRQLIVLYLAGAGCVMAGVYRWGSGVGSCATKSPPCTNLLAGAGRVRLGLLEPAFPVDAEWPELMVTDGSELFAHTHDVYAIGPGLGTSQAATTILRRVLALPHPLVIDADALNLIAIHAELQHALCARDAATVLTPHPAEAARLLALTTNEIQNDRITAGRALVQRLNVVVVLKGSGTLTAHHEGMWINGSGNGALGVAGQGDVLTGLIAALLAQGLSPLKACRLGVFVHGQAGDQWRQGQPNGIGLRAMETALLARDLLNQLS
ncbi:NAD(P)H-hydrate dehydratase [Chitinibacteraceae bacterium HSL-7]